VSAEEVKVLWAFLSSILACQLIALMLNVVELMRLILQAFRRKKSTGGKL